MTVEQAISHFGSVKALAAFLNIYPQVVYQWKEIPMGRQYELEVRTNGALKAERDKS